MVEQSDKFLVDDLTCYGPVALCEPLHPLAKFIAPLPLKFRSFLSAKTALVRVCATPPTLSAFIHDNISL